MVYDGHTHIGSGPADQSGLLKKMDQAGIEKTVMLAQGPDRGALSGQELQSFNRRRLLNLLDWTKDCGRLAPVYFINPIEQDAASQVDEAVARGVVGFKVICANHMPGDERALPVYARMAELKKPVLFHCGILWGKEPSANFNRPGNFEAMLLVPGLKFALAHVGWPWCDETIAVFGKFLSAERYGEGGGQQLYIDNTPGTPTIYRQEVLTKLLTVGYKGIERRLMFGVDNFTASYDPAYGKGWIERDMRIYRELNIGEDVIDRIFYKNCMEFWGID